MKSKIPCSSCRTQHPLTKALALVNTQNNTFKKCFGSAPKQLIVNHFKYLSNRSLLGAEEVRKAEGRGRDFGGSVETKIPFR